MRCIKSIKDLESKNAGLKIPSWVTLTCRFKSGPGHQTLINIEKYDLRAFGRLGALKSRKEAFGVSSDTPVTHGVTHG